MWVKDKNLKKKWKSLQASVNNNTKNIYHIALHSVIFYLYFVMYL